MDLCLQPAESIRAQWAAQFAPTRPNEHNREDRDHDAEQLEQQLILAAKYQSLRELHEDYAHTPGQFLKFARASKHRLKVRTPGRNVTDCSRCDAVAELLPIDATRMPTPERPGHYVNAAAIRFRGVRIGVVYADEYTGYLVPIAVSGNETFAGGLHSAYGLLDVHPQSRRGPRYLRTRLYNEESVHLRRSLGDLNLHLIGRDAPESDRGPYPIIRIAGDAFGLRDYLEYRMQRVAESLHHPIDDPFELLMYICQVHNATPFADQPSAALELGGLVDDRLRPQFHEEIEAFHEGRWQPAIFLSWSSHYMHYRVRIGSRVHEVERIARHDRR